MNVAIWNQKLGPLKKLDEHNYFRYMYTLVPVLLNIIQWASLCLVSNLIVINTIVLIFFREMYFYRTKILIKYIFLWMKKLAHFQQNSTHLWKFYERLVLCPWILKWEKCRRLIFLISCLMHCKIINEYRCWYVLWLDDKVIFHCKYHLVNTQVFIFTNRKSLMYF